MRYFWLLLSAVWILFLARAWGPLPALGPLLDFQHGVWDHHEFEWRDRHVRGLKSPVTVAIDKNGVPHLFAQNEADLYRAQGFLIASQRLFQIDVSTRSTSGYLGDLVGAKGLKMDRFFVQFGAREAEEAMYAQMMSDPQTAEMVSNFVAGVNDWERQMEDLPVEYKFLGAKPSPMDGHIVSRMAKAMAFSLAGGSADLALSHLQKQMSVAKILDLFPEFLPSAYEDYVFPTKGGPPRTPESVSDFAFKTHIEKFPEIPHPPSFNGSNNWVVAPRKSATGHSLLANDTHLDYKLPSVWFENQLWCPEFNVYGVSFPAVPGVVAGFNSRIAWGPTNGATDALDYFEVEFENKSSLRYKVGAGWEEARVVPEKLAGAEVLEVPWTKWGPVLYREGKYALVVLWTGAQASNEIKALRQLYGIQSAKECLRAFEGWRVPLQNFACADPDHIGLVHAGYIPRRKIGEGRFIGRPEDSFAALRETIPAEAQPLAYDPPEGYLRSANERIMGPEFPYYMGWDYSDPFRAMSIRRELEGQDKLSSQDLMRIQNGDFDAEAERLVPTLLKLIGRGDLSADQVRALEDLAHWDFHMRADSVSPTIFRQWFVDLRHLIFDDEYTLKERPGFYPHEARILWMLERLAENPHDSDTQWIDDKKTKTKQTLSEVVTRAYLKAWKNLEQKFGAQPARWKWGEFNKTQFPHLAGIPGFGSDAMMKDGSAYSINGNRGWHGAVYKFVIELGDRPRAWMQVPGGISGDPLSRQFENFLPEWQRGEMHEVEYYTSPEDARAHAAKVIQLIPEGA